MSKSVLQALRDAGVHHSVVQESLHTSTNLDSVVNLVNRFLDLTANGGGPLIDALINFMGQFHQFSPQASPIKAPTEEQTWENLIEAGVDTEALHEGVKQSALNPATVISWTEIILSMAAKYGPGVITGLQGIIDALAGPKAAALPDDDDDDEEDDETYSGHQDHPARPPVVGGTNPA